MPKLNLKHGHSFCMSPREAIALQQDLRQRISLCDRPGRPRIVAGADVGFDKHRGISRAAVVLLDYDDLTLLESARAECPTSFPYVPGLLSFREIPVILAALERTRLMPDLIICDGHGLAHPRRFGLACHLGLLLDLPCIGVGKTRLIGRYAEPGREKGSSAPLMDTQERIGTVLRTRTDVSPVFVSPGHAISHETAVRRVMQCVTRYRLPQTTRLADRLASHSA
ncbi:MAG: deoxyribonuclease V [Gammaproteobacteria bacterium]|nr:deoxyribonuclease V [Gammaproteobacteria bacterium]